MHAYLELDGRRIDLPEGETTIGRSRRSGVTLEDPTVSRTHALLSVHQGRVTVADLDSSNGTFVNGKRLETEAALFDGDRLTLGSTDLVVRVVAEEGAEGTPPEHPPRSRCSQCGSHLSPGAKSCGVCGAPASAAEGLSPSEALGVGDVLPTGEVLSSRDPSWESTAAAVRPSPGPREEGEVFKGSRVAARQAAPREPTPTAPATERATGELLPPISAVERPRPRTPVKPVFLPPAGFWLRLLAWLVDGLWMSGVAVGASYLRGGPVTVEGGMVASAVLGGLSFLVPVVGWAVWGTTPGKRLFRLYVCRQDGRVGIGLGRALLRWLGYLLSALTLGVGFLMAGLMASKRSLHDLLAGTYVGRRSKGLLQTAPQRR